jgi:outer membrane lipoprotein-sorting protein
VFRLGGGRHSVAGTGQWQFTGQPIISAEGKQVRMKHYAVLALGLLAGALPAADPAQQNEAEKLFRDMEKKIQAAKAFRVAFTVEIKGDAKERAGRFEGSLLLTKANQARMVISEVRGQSRKWELVSNGKQLRWEGATSATPKKFHGLASLLVSRVGVFPTTPVISIAIAEADKLDRVEGSKLTAWDFKAGAAEKIDGRDAKVVRFKVGEKGDRDAAAVTLWIDSKTLPPLKRVAVVNPRSAEVITEVYKQFTLDPKVGAKTFELRK